MAANGLELSAARALTAGVGGERASLRSERDREAAARAGIGRPWPTRISSNISSLGTQVLGNHVYCYNLQTRGFNQCMTLLLV